MKIWRKNIENENEKETGNENPNMKDNDKKTGENEVNEVNEVND